MSVSFKNEEVFSQRVLDLGPLGFGALMLLCGWSDNQETDGVFRSDIAQRLAINPQTIAKLLRLGEIRDGAVPGTYEIVHYARYSNRGAS